MSKHDSAPGRCLALAGVVISSFAWQCFVAVSGLHELVRSTSADFIGEDAARCLIAWSLSLGGAFCFPEGGAGF